jgi:hypothetical protein
MFRALAGAAVVAAAIGFPTIGLIANHSGISKSPVVYVACPPGSYRNSSGNCVEDPDSSPQNPTAKCCDGTESHSQHRSGTCSGHGGVCQWNDFGPGYSDNPSLTWA